MPLVYEMVRLGIFRPCWSCEGHVGNDGALWKVPRVWFYCDSVTHLRLLTDGLKDMHHAGALSASWQLVVTFSDRDNLDTTFSLEPTLPPDRLPPLPSLQKDVAAIATSLRNLITRQARDLQRDAGAALAESR